MWAKTVSNQSKIGLGHWRLPRAGQSPYYFTLGHLRPSPVLPLLVLGVRVSVSKAGGVLHHRPKELHRGPLPPERAVHTTIPAPCCHCCNVVVNVHLLPACPQPVPHPLSEDSALSARAPGPAVSVSPEQTQAHIQCHQHHKDGCCVQSVI